MVSRSKRYNEISEKIDSDKVYTLDEGIELIKDSSNLKFDETVDIAVNLNIDPTFSDQNVRGVINLPNGIGKDLRVAVFAKGDKAKEAEDSGADIVGSEDLVEKVSSGDIDFERCIATPDMMPLVGRLGKVLGPKGLMPNPKLGTVTDNIKGVVKALKSGQIEIKNDKLALANFPAATSCGPPISPIIKTASVSLSSSNFSKISLKELPLIGSPPIPTLVEIPIPKFFIC